jgi:rare lipoprotein A
MATDGPAHSRALALIVLTGLLLAGCASEPPVASSSAGPGTYRVGVPYKIKGVWYYPAVDYNYDTTGTASWYGEEFEGRLTANGEIFDLNQLTAAHTTLPMPSIVQVTNLENGRSLQLRVNDRGPFVDGRLIDVSRRAAQLLGFERRGTTLVRVKILKEESIAAAEEAMHGRGQIVLAEAATASAVAATAAPPAYSSVAAPVPVFSPQAAPLVARRATAPAPLVAQREPQPSPASNAGTVSSEPTTPRSAMAQREPVPSPSLAPIPSYPTQPSPSRFSLIGSAEAAELPPGRAPARNHAIVALKSAIGNEPSGRIYVQAGAFSMRGNAQRVQSRIALLGSAQVTAASVNGTEMYRVRLGPFRSAAEADRLLARLVGSGYREARVVGD